MITVAGVFRSRERAGRAVGELRKARLQQINLLTPGSTDLQVDSVPTSDAEQPGMGKAVGGVVGGALGVAGGLGLGTAASTLLVPGVGPVVAVGLAAAAILGAGGAVGGAAAGAALEKDTTTGLPADELFVYKDALRQGRSVIFVQAGDDDEVERARQTLAQAGAESIDAAREEWWIGLRSAEQEHYHALGGNFAQDEQAYRQGFEAALRGDSATHRSDDAVSEAYRCGYQRGKSYRGEL
jgi:hypothetical protein